ncbi:MAG: hypothetical protein J0M24_03250 [Verrucomicrobia bacterium]|nr:hypothetical protein [Verrucomicrobiota bacterium]
MRLTTKIVTKVVWIIGFQAKLRLNPIKGRYDPTCGSGPSRVRFVQEEKFVESHGGTGMRHSAKRNHEASPRELREAKHHRCDISVYGQESNVITGIEALCDQPEAQPTTTQAKSHRLFEALLHHALPA